MSWVKAVLSWCFTIGLVMEAFLFSEDVSSAVLGPIITTKAGSFQGLKVIPPGQKHAVYAFLGIPYAEPPTGLNRFKKPKPIGFITGVYNATDKPPSCFQDDSVFPLHWIDTNSTMSEDCLYLNIWAPERHGAEEGLKPVIVWIHGGGYATGSSAIDVYDGQVISALGEVVVVTLNYRLAAFGFLSSLTEDAPGNVALYDQLMVLHWVQTNIEYFGGDPKKVTLSGESAGAMCTGFLALSSLSRGLFHRLIVQSGSSYASHTQSPSIGAETGNRLAGLVGCANDTFDLFSHPKEVVDCLRTVPANELTKIYYEQQGSTQQRISLYYGAQFWDDVIPRNPVDIFRSGNYTTYDVFVGVTQAEGSSLFAYFLPEVYQQFIDGKLTINKTLAVTTLNGFLKETNIAHPEKPIDFYLKDVGDDQQAIVKAIYEVIGDYVIVCPTIYFAEKYSEKRAHVQFYRFDHTPSTSPWPKWMGAAHFEEVQFVFGMPVRYPEKYQEGEKELSEYMIRTWTNFVKSENLTLENGSQWPNFSRLNPEYATLQTGGQQVTGSGERKTQCEFWRPYFEGP